LQWFVKGERGRPPKANEDTNNFDRGVIFRNGGRIEVFEPSGTFSMSAPFYAMGSGKSEALGAMWAGATAEQAVRAAIDLDPSCGGDVTILSHQAAKKMRKS
jgi:ATP-dependent HslUV protease subunit HslV